MSFDNDPKDEKENYQCQVCFGVISKKETGVWECNQCTWTSDLEKKREKEDESENKN